MTLDPVCHKMSHLQGNSIFMEKKIVLFMMLLFFQGILSGIGASEGTFGTGNIVTSTKRIHLSNYPGAYNPSIVKFNDGYLLTFRFLPDRTYQPWISFIGVVLLDESFEPISRPEILDTRSHFKATPSQAEDARIFSFNDKLYLVFNDNVDLVFPSPWERRDMYVAELIYDGNQFYLADPVKLIHESKYPFVLWQKNWSPFEWNGSLLLSYTLNPHEVVALNWSNGCCRPCYETAKSINWNFGTIRGGTPALLLDGEYLAFFHSGIVTTSTCSENREMWHYVMGAYTFTSEPPFELTKISSLPIDSPGFYTYSSYGKRVIYPGGFVVSGPNLYLAYGKDDSELWIATINIKALKDSMVPLKQGQ